MVHGGETTPLCHYVLMKIAPFRVPFLKATPLNGKTIHFGLHLRLARQLPVNFEQLELIEAFLGSSGKLRRWHRFGTFWD